MSQSLPALHAIAGRAFRWSALTTAGRFVLQLVAQVLLARLLGPDNDGVDGIGLVVLTFAAFLSGNAFSDGLMLQQRISDADIRFAFTWQLLAGLACSAVLWALAGSLAGFFGDARVLPMVHWMAVARMLLDLVQLLYGPAWADAAWVMAVLFLCVPAFACWGVSTPVLWNTGRKHLEVQLQLPVLAVALPAWWLAAPSGLRAVALVSAGVVTARAVLIVAAGLRAPGLQARLLLPIALHGLLLAAVCAAAVAAGRELLLDWTPYPVALESSLDWYRGLDAAPRGSAASDSVRTA